MRSKRSVWISMLAVFFVMVISLGSAGALVPGDYEDTWHKVKFKFKGVCEDPAFELFKDSQQVTAWIYIESYAAPNFTGYLVTQDEDGTWQENAITLSVVGGTADDAVLELVGGVTITDGFTGDVSSILSAFIRLTGKEKNMALKSAKLKSITVETTFDIVGFGVFCWGSAQASGKLTDVGKVPAEVEATIP